MFYFTLPIDRERQLEAPVTRRFVKDITKLVAVKVHVLCRGSTDLAILFDQHSPDDPSTGKRQEGESSRGTKANAVARLVKLEPEISTPDVTNLTNAC